MASVTAPFSKSHLGILTVLVVSCASCESYEPPCTAHDPVLALDAHPTSNSVATYPRVRHAADGTMVASWLTFRTSNDGSLPTYLPVTAEVAVLANDGLLLEYHSLPLFEDVDSENVPTDNFAFCFTPHGVVLRWTNNTTVSAIGEPPRIRTSLRVQRMSLDGETQPSFAPLNMDCVNCVVHVDSACHRDHATILFHAWPEDPLESSPTRALSWNLVTDETIAGPISWIEPASPQKPPPTLRNDTDTLLLFEESQAWAVDSEAGLRGGPIPLPVASNYLVHWSADTFESLVVWSLAGSTNEEPLDDVFMKRFNGHGQPLSTVKRLGASSNVLALAEDDHDVGLIFGDEGQLAFAWADTSGSRLGGDVRLNEGPSFVLKPGQAIAPGASQILRALGQGRFVHVTGEPGRLWRREIRCVP